MKTAIIIGAGCSAGLAKLPTDDSFLRDSVDSINKKFFLKEALNRLYVKQGKADIEYPRLEICWNEIDENYNSPKIILDPESIRNLCYKLRDLAKEEKNNRYKYYHQYLYKDSQSRSPCEYLFIFAGWELKNLVIKKLNININTKIKEKYDKLVKKIDKEAAGEKDYIVLNYDVLLESSLTNWFYIGFDSNSQGSKVPVIKPHGSINWLHDFKDETIVPMDKPIPPDKLGYLNDSFYEHSIIGLIAYKRPFTGREQNDLIKYVYNERILGYMNKVLKESEQLIIIGYSFPCTDEHIKKAFRELNSDKLKKVILVTKNNKGNASGSLRKKISELLRINVEKIEYFDQGVEKWI